MQAPSIQQHRLAADLTEIVGHFEIVKRGMIRKNVLEQSTELGDVQLAVAQIVDQLPDGILVVDAEEREKGII